MASKPKAKVADVGAALDALLNGVAYLAVIEAALAMPRKDWLDGTETGLRHNLILALNALDGVANELLAMKDMATDHRDAQH